MGRLAIVEQDGFRWDSGPTHTLLPAVLRDLFRKSGRALEKEVELVPVEPVARHVFEDGTELDLPGGSRARPDGGDGLARSRAGRQLGGVRRRVLRRLGGTAPRLARAPLLGRAREQADQGPALHPADDAQAHPEGVRGRAAAPGRGLPDDARGPRPAQRAGLDGHVDLRRAELRRLDGPRRDGLAGRRAGRAPADAWRDRAALHRGPRPRALQADESPGSAPTAVSSTPTRSSWRSTPAGCPRWRRW